MKRIIRGFAVCVDWVVLLPLWRRLIRDPLWRVPAAIFTGIAVAIVVLAIAVIVAAALFPGESDAEKDRRNEEVMASLPTYPGVTCTQKFKWDNMVRVPSLFYNPLRRFRTLTYRCLMPDGARSEEAVDFYSRELIAQGWKPVNLNFGARYALFKDGYYFYAVSDGPDVIELNVAKR